MHLLLILLVILAFPTFVRSLLSVMFWLVIAAAVLALMESILR